MSTTQKLETSREIRQWIGLGISAVGLSLFIWKTLSPNTFDKAVEKIRRKF